MREDLLALAERRISFDVFVSRTRQQWERLGRYLLRRWAAPGGVDLDDVVQELLLGVHVALPKFNPARGVDIRRYAVYNATDKAKKWLHRQRNAYRRDDKADGRYPASFTALGWEELEPDWAAATGPTAVESLVEAEEATERVARCRGVVHSVLPALSTRDRYCAVALADAQGDVEDAVSALWNDPRSCLVLRLGSEPAVRTAVQAAAREIASAVVAAD